MPLLKHAAMQMAWGAVATRDINEKMLSMSSSITIVLGQTRRMICLLLPPSLTFDDTSAVNYKDGIQSLEGSILTYWTHQIKEVRAKARPNSMPPQQPAPNTSPRC